MTYHSVIFNRRVNLTAPLEAYQQSILLINTEKIEIPTPRG